MCGLRDVYNETRIQSERLLRTRLQDLYWKGKHILLALALARTALKEAIIYIRNIMIEGVYIFLTIFSKFL